MIKRLAVLAFFVLAAGSAQAKTLHVVASFTILGDLVRQIGGEHVVVTTLVGPEGDAHVYEPTPNDVRTMAAADLVVINGLHMEGWIERLIKASSTKAPVVVASKGIKTRAMVEDRKTVTDPHGWQDVANGITYGANIADGLVAADPEDGDYFRARTESYLAALADLDRWVRAQIALIPAEKRRVITSHDAFGYFGRAYGVTFLAPQGISTEAEAKPAELGKLIRQVRQTHVKAIFLENMSDPRLVEELARESGAVVGGTLYVDALSAENGPAASYIQMFQHNVPMLVEAMLKN